MSREVKYSAAILAGGRSRRFGKPKARALFRGKALIRTVMEVVAPEVDDLFIVANDESFRDLGVPVYPDAYDSRGPLAGLATALKKARYDSCFLLGCDLPFLKKPLFDELKKFREYEAVVPQHDSHIEPLAALYHRKVLPVIEAQMAGGRFKMQEAIEKMNYHYLQTEDHEALTPDLFVNLNTPEELKKWE